MFRSFAALLLVGCLASVPVQAEVRLLTSIKPLQLIAAAVQDGAGTPQVLLPPGASPHHYALRPSDVRALREARLFYWIGPDLEAFLPRVLEGREQPSLALRTLPGLRLRHFADGQGAEGDEVDPDHRPGSLDAHLWLLPANARLIAARMAADLASADPANAARYRANLAAFEQRLDALDQRLKARLATVAGKPYFVFHEAYDYFEAAYGLEHAGVFSLSPEVQPGARQVARMRQRLQDAGPTCVFSEPPLQPRLARTLSAGLPVQLAELDPLGSSVALGPRGYEQLLERLGEGLVACLGAL